jgi:hypothetical protein
VTLSISCRLHVRLSEHEVFQDVQEWQGKVSTLRRNLEEATSPCELVEALYPPWMTLISSAMKFVCT